MGSLFSVFRHPSSLLTWSSGGTGDNTSSSSTSEQTVSFPSFEGILGLDNCASALKRVFNPAWKRTPRFKALAILGRARVGKRSMIEEFCVQQDINLFTITRFSEFAEFSMYTATAVADGQMPLTTFPTILSIYLSSVSTIEHEEMLLDMINNISKRAPHIGIVILATMPLSSSRLSSTTSHSLGRYINAGIYYAAAPSYAMRERYLHARLLKNVSVAEEESEIARLVNVSEGYTIGELANFIDQCESMASAEEMDRYFRMCFQNQDHFFSLQAQNEKLDAFFERQDATASRKRPRPSEPQEKLDDMHNPKRTRPLMFLPSPPPSSSQPINTAAEENAVVGEGGVGNDMVITSF